MLAVLEAAQLFFPADLPQRVRTMPTSDSLKDCPISLSDLATMDGHDRVAAFVSAHVDPLVIPYFLRGLQHLTAVYASGSVETKWRLHRSTSAHSWGTLSHPWVLNGYPHVISKAYHPPSLSASEWRSHGEQQQHPTHPTPSTANGATTASLPSSPPPFEGTQAGVAFPVSPLASASRPPLGFPPQINGLVNQGATCYLNSLLQALFHISEFRSIIYGMPTKEEETPGGNNNGGGGGDSAGGQSPSAATSHTATTAAGSGGDGGGDRPSGLSVPHALQRVFCRLQTANASVDTNELTSSFGWSASDGFVQHDVHELLHVLLNNIEEKLTAAAAAAAVPAAPSAEQPRNPINALFQGVLENYVSVAEAGYEGSREELFYDLQLVVKNHKDIYSSFNAFFQVEVLDGANRYCLEQDDGRRTYHRAEKGVRLKQSPPILLLHLTRFDFSMQLGESKVCSEWAYYSTLDLSPYMPHCAGDPTKTHYTLYSVLVHMGTNTGNGHYYCFVRCGGVWFRFNDEAVTAASLRDVFGSHFGGHTLNYWGSEVPHMNNAYMLMYIRTADTHRLLRPIGESDLPAHVVQQLALEEQERRRLEKERDEDYLYGRIQFVLPEDLMTQDGEDDRYTDVYFHGRLTKATKASAQRVARVLLEEDLLEASMAYLKHVRICDEAAMESVLLWMPTEPPTTTNPRSLGSSRTNRSVNGVSQPSDSSSRRHPHHFTDAADTAGHRGATVTPPVYRVVRPGTQVKQVVAGGETCMLFVTASPWVPTLTLVPSPPLPTSNSSFCFGSASPPSGTPEPPKPALDEAVVVSPLDSAGDAKQQQQQQPEASYKLLLIHHLLYDALRLHVISLGSTVVRIPVGSHIPSRRILKELEKRIQKLSDALPLDFDEQRLYQHDLRAMEKKDPSHRPAAANGRLCGSVGCSPPSGSDAALATSPHADKKAKTVATTTTTDTNSPPPPPRHTYSEEKNIPPTLITSLLKQCFGDAPVGSPAGVRSGSTTPSALSLTSSRRSSITGRTGLSVFMQEDPTTFTRLYRYSETGDHPLTTPGATSVPYPHSLSSGAVLLWQLPVDPCDLNTFYSDIIAFQSFKEHLVEFELRLNLPPANPILIRCKLSANLTYEQLQRYVARLIGEPVADRIRFTRHCVETSQPFFMKGNRSERPTLGHLLATHRAPQSPITPGAVAASWIPKLYYERCKFPVTVIEKSHSLQYQLYSKDVKPISSHWLLFPLQDAIRKEGFFQRVVEDVRADTYGLRPGSNQNSQQPSSSFSSSEEEENTVLTQASPVAAASPVPNPTHTPTPPPVEGAQLSTADSPAHEGSRSPWSPCSLPSPLMASPFQKSSDRSAAAAAAMGLSPPPPLAPVGEAKWRSIQIFMDRCDPAEAWRSLRLLDVWRGRIYGIFDATHPLHLPSQRRTFEESAQYRIEFAPQPLPSPVGAFTSPPPSRSAAVMPKTAVGSPVSTTSGDMRSLAGGGAGAGGTLGSSITSHSSVGSPRVYTSRQVLLHFYHYSYLRTRREPVDTHSDPFSMYVAYEELVSEVQRRVAAKLDLPLLALQDWGMAMVQEKRVVSLHMGATIGEQLLDFCGGDESDVDAAFAVNTAEPLKTAFIGLEHAAAKLSRREEKVVIRG